MPTKTVECSIFLLAKNPNESFKPRVESDVNTRLMVPQQQKNKKTPAKEAEPRAAPSIKDVDVGLTDQHCGLQNSQFLPVAVRVDEEQNLNREASAV